MAKLSRTRLSSGNPIARVFIQDSSSTTGAGLTGLTSSSSGLKATLMRELDATTTNYTVSGSTLESITTLGTYAAPTATKMRFKEIDATNLPGWYEIHIAQALLGTGDSSRFLSGMIFGATNVAPCPFEIELTGNVEQSGDSYTKLPSSPAAVGSAMTLATDSVNAAALATDAVTEILTAMFGHTTTNFSTITLDSKINAILAMVAGITSGGGTTSEVFKDQNGNTVVTITLNSTDRTGTSIA